MTIGERIKAIRLDKGITQTDLANAAKISKQNLYKYENGIITNIPSDKIEAIAKFLGVSPAKIMGWESEQESEISIGIDLGYGETSVSTQNTTSETGDELNDLLERLRRRPECQMLFKLADGATREDIEKAVAIIEALRGVDKK